MPSLSDPRGVWCVDCGCESPELELLHWDHVCPHCRTLRRSIARTGAYDGPLFPPVPAAGVTMRTYREACELVGGTLRTLPLSQLPLLHDTWTSLLPPPIPPGRLGPIAPQGPSKRSRKAAPARSSTTDEDGALMAEDDPDYSG